jgi:predicted DNA-binding ribbon-helix-helix protein
MTEQSQNKESSIELRLDPALLNRLKEIADARRSDVAHLITQVLSEFIAKHDHQGSSLDTSILYRNSEDELRHLLDDDLTSMRSQSPDQGNDR